MNDVRRILRNKRVADPGLRTVDGESFNLVATLVPTTLLSLPEMKFNIPYTHHYIRISIQPPIIESLALRQILQRALDQSFGLTRALTHIDILWIAVDGSEAVIKFAAESVISLDSLV
jgi:hypothetical protein